MHSITPANICATSEIFTLEAAEVFGKAQCNQQAGLSSFRNSLMHLIAYCKNKLIALVLRMIVHWTHLSNSGTHGDFKHQHVLKRTTKTDICKDPKSLEIFSFSLLTDLGSLDRHQLGDFVNQQLSETKNHSISSAQCCQTLNVKVLCPVRLVNYCLFSQETSVLSKVFPSPVPGIPFYWRCFCKQRAFH